MNIPEVYLVEPYNAYAPKRKQKHWHEVIEEQALMAKIMAEQQALHEAQNSRTLPPNSPSIATPEVVATPPAGGGGIMPHAAYNPQDAVVNGDRTPASGVAPLVVQFTNLTTNPSLYIYRWEFGDGTYSNDPNPIHVYATSSGATNIWTASLQVSSSATLAGVGSISNIYTSASIPTVTAAFTAAWPATLTSSYYTASVNTAFQLINGSSTTGGPLTYQWSFGSASAGSNDTNPIVTYTKVGTYTILLGVTGSYGIKSAGSRKVLIV